jgi:hypothetical protein
VQAAAAALAATAIIALHSDSKAETTKDARVAAAAAALAIPTRNAREKFPEARRALGVASREIRRGQRL